MPELKVTISETTHKTLLTMVEDSGETIQSVLDRAIENYRRSKEKKLHDLFARY
ncbi:hypothetical protein PN450_08105 [Dolichospermum lemmermannii CS-548]|uniref:hypothetical protein n=1 Tax=Dolichospermum lemmermannii TaxID=54295 RepID=UPI0023305729|nr:hypothetical protein [Dolichospermum lemmermannii]MDB9436768.1 hypothetical protein [Dolichospermum lemmermannii CS-548]